MGKLSPSVREERAKTVVKQLLSATGWKSWTELTKEARKKRLSTATLSKHIKRFAEEGLILREERETEWPRVFYKLADDYEVKARLRDLDALGEEVSVPEIKLTPEQEKVQSDLFLSFDLLHLKILNLIYGALKSPKQENFLKDQLMLAWPEFLFVLNKVREARKFYHKTLKSDLADDALRRIMEEIADEASEWLPDWTEELPGYPEYLHPMVAEIILKSKSKEDARRKINDMIRTLYTPSPQENLERSIAKTQLEAS